MDLPRIARETATVLINYLTFQAVKIILEQMTEMDLPASVHFRNFSANYGFQQSEIYLQDLLQENREWALRVMTVREHLAEALLDYLPTMVLSQVREANLEQRRHLLERLTQTAEEDPETLEPWASREARSPAELNPTDGPEDS
jgi:hypothetical protein